MEKRKKSSIQILCLINEREKRDVLRINEKSGDEEHKILQLEGKVCRQWLDELRTEIDRTVAEGKKLVLDFSRVTFIDEEGARLISRSLSDRVESINCSLFVRALLEMDSGGIK